VLSPLSQSNWTQGKETEMAHLVDDIMAYEAGEFDHNQTVELFQTLLNNGMVWHLQGHYGRTAQALLESGDIAYPADKKGNDNA
jgi:hypothetical protein